MPAAAGTGQSKNLSGAPRLPTRAGWRLARPPARGPAGRAAWVAPVQAATAGWTKRQQPL